MPVQWRTLADGLNEDVRLQRNINAKLCSSVPQASLFDLWLANVGEENLQYVVEVTNKNLKKVRRWSTELG